MARAKLLNVRLHLERVERLTQDLIKHNGEERGVQLPPSYLDELKSISLFTRAILRVHKEKGTRKDIYVDRT